MHTVTAQWPHMGALQTVVSLSLMCRPPSTPFSFTWWLWQPGCSSVFIFTPLDNSGQYRQNASNGLCTGMVTGEQSCDSVWTLKRILDLVVQFMPPPYFFFFFRFRYCILLQCWYHYCFFFQVQEINKVPIWCMRYSFAHINVWKEPHDVSIIWIVLKGDKFSS